MTSGTGVGATPADAGPSSFSPSPFLRRLAGERAAERVFRVLAFGFLPGGALFGLLAGPAIAAQAGAWPRWWSVTVFCAVVIPPIVFGLLAFTAPVRVIRALAGLNTIGTLVALASVPFVIRTPGSIGDSAWLNEIAGIGLIAAVLVARPMQAAVVALAGAVLSCTARLATDDTDALLQGVQDGLYVLLFTVTFIALGVSSLAAGRAADAAEAEAQAAANDAAADAARDREQARVDALVHDRVLATLLSTARRIPGASALERHDANRALDGLEALLVDGGPAAEDLDGAALVWQVQALTTELAPEAVFGYEVAAAERAVEAETAEALLQATEEALRNSLLHAGEANRTVHVQVDAEGVDVDVLDDGVGFDPAAVPAGRLGIAESIEGRMRALAGGSAFVVTEPGVGTRVRLRWRAP